MGVLRNESALKRECLEMGVIRNGFINESDWKWDLLEM